MAGYGMIRVVTWNVWGRFGPWEERWPAIVDELRTLDPDVIALQETWRDEERTQARLLADELGYPHWAHEDVEQVGGIAIVSRLPLMAKRRLDLQYSGHGEWPGTALIAGVEADFGVFDVACVVEYGTIFRVLGSSASSAGRLLAYRVIVDELTARDRDIPPVLLGDLNATPYDEDMRGPYWQGARGWRRLDLQRRMGNASRSGGRLDVRFAGEPLAAGYPARWPLPDRPRAARPLPRLSPELARRGRRALRPRGARRRRRVRPLRSLCRPRAHRSLLILSVARSA